MLLHTEKEEGFFSTEKTLSAEKIINHYAVSISKDAADYLSWVDGISRSAAIDWALNNFIDTESHSPTNSRAIVYHFCSTSDKKTCVKEQATCCLRDFYHQHQNEINDEINKHLDKEACNINNFLMDGTKNFQQRLF